MGTRTTPVRSHSFATIAVSSRSLSAWYFACCLSSRLIPAGSRLLASSASSSASALSQYGGASAIASRDTHEAMGFAIQHLQPRRMDLGLVGELMHSGRMHYGRAAFATADA